MSKTNKKTAPRGRPIKNTMSADYPVLEAADKLVQTGTEGGGRGCPAEKEKSKQWARCRQRSSHPAPPNSRTFAAAGFSSDACQSNCEAARGVHDNYHERHGRNPRGGRWL